jgi:hypothetical protein
MAIAAGGDVFRPGMWCDIESACVVQRVIDVVGNNEAAINRRDPGDRIDRYRPEQQVQCGDNHGAANQPEEPRNLPHG